MNVIDNMLARYEINSEEEHKLAIREIMQEIALAGLYRGGFFNKAAFYGGTCLRIFYDLDRFSEDLDFSLLEKNKKFSLDPYFKSITEEFVSLGFEVDITSKKKTSNSTIESAFLKKNSSIYDLSIQKNNSVSTKAIKIKFEVDKDPPLGFATEDKLLLNPFSFYVKSFSLPDLFAGKVHALLFRKWKNRVKGRDWYDFAWYVSRGCELNLNHFSERARQSGDTCNLSSPTNQISSEQLKEMIKTRISELDFKHVREDVVRFIKQPEKLDIWSKDYFEQLVERLVVK